MATKKAAKKASKGTGVSPILVKEATEVAPPSEDTAQRSVRTTSLPVLGAPLPAPLFPDPATLGTQPPNFERAGEATREASAFPPMPAEPLLPRSGQVVPAMRRQVNTPAMQQRWRQHEAGVQAGPQRKFHPTFDPLPQLTQEARHRAQQLRTVLGRTIESILQAVWEVDQVEAFVQANPEAAKELERMEVSLDDARRFRKEALEVVELFKPVEEGQGEREKGKGVEAA